MEKKAGKQPLEELADMLRTLQEKEKIQDCMVQKFQKLFREKDLPSSVIRNFPYPIAVFDQDGDLVFVNSALSEETGLYTADLSKSKHSIFNRITDENLQILDAAENVFMGKTTFLTGLSDPLDIFMSDNSGEKISSSEYREAFFFPVVKDKGQTTQGAVIFMKQGFMKTE